MFPFAVSASCATCDKLSAILEKLGKAYKENAEVVIARMNAVANTLQEIEIEDFPTIILFPKGDKNEEDYEGNLTEEALARFIDSDGQDDGEFIEPVEKKSATEISTQKGTSKEMPSVTASNVSNGTVQTFNSCTSRLDICQFLVVQTPML